MNDFKNIIEDVNKSDIISDKVIEKIIEKIGQKEWQELHDKYSDIMTTTGEVAIALRILKRENEQLKVQNEKMKNWCNCQNYLECLTNYVEKTKQSYKKEFCYNCKKWKLKER